jgi:glutamate synthase domain-containing protein 1
MKTEYLIIGNSAGGITAAEAIRQVYSSLLLHEPFTVFIAHQGEMIGLMDRIRLRLLTIGEKDSVLYLSSEESTICLVCSDLDKAWIPMSGQPVVGRLKEKAETRVEVTV